MAYWDCPETYNIGTKFMGKVLDYKNKEEIVTYYFRLILNKTQSMFEWKGLPETIGQRELELLLQTNGSAIFIENGGKHFVLYGTLGGLWNYNYMPTMAIVHNPYIPQVDGAYEIYYGEEEVKHIKNNLTPKGKCVVIQNDALYNGLNAIINTYANRLAETYISRRMVTIMSRYINVFVAKDNNTYKNIEAFLKKVENGDIAAILDEDKIKIMEEGNIYSLPLAANAGSARMITELIEAEQYDKASLYNELGLQSNYNMKRESLNSNEGQLNRDAIFPLADSMLKFRQLACERINKLFGLNISVDFASAWKLNRDEAELAIEQANALVNNQSEVKDDNNDISNSDSTDDSTDSDNDDRSKD